MKKSLLIWGLAIVLLITVLWVSKNNNGNDNDPDSSSGSKTNVTENTALPDADSPDKAIDFTLSGLDGKEVSLSDFKGKNVFLNFWATWCPPCRSEMPDIEEVSEDEYKDLVILAVNLGEDKDTVKSFIESNKYKFKILLDPNQSTALKYNITSIPVSYFIDKDGRVSAKRIGAMSYEQMKSYISLLEK